MLEKITIARPYAQAIFDYAKEQGDFDKWSGLLKLLAGISSDPLMHTLINNPRVNDDVLFEIYREICSGNLDESGSNLIRILIDAGRLTVVPEIYNLYHNMWADYKGLAEVTVVSAYPLSDEQARLINEAMARKLGKKIEINSSVDESLIGGAVIRAGDSAIDASIRGRLEKLSNEFI